MDENWRDIGDWKGSSVSSSSKAAMWISLIFGVAFTGISAPLVLTLPDELDKGNELALLMLLFPLVGVGALAMFIRTLVALRKFGNSVVEMNPVPGSVGGDFGGTLFARIPFAESNVVNLSLSCQHLRTTGSGDNRSTTTSVLWQREGVAITQAGERGGTDISFKFQVPADQPQSETTSSDYRRWVLQLDCDLAGVDLRRSFVVPVFQSDEPQQSSLAIPYVKDSAPLEVAPSSRVEITDTATGVRLYYPWYRHLLPALFAMVFGAVFVAAGLFAGAESGSVMFPLIFCGVGGAVAVFGLYRLGNTLTVTVSPEGVHTVRNVFGVRFQRRAARDDIESLERAVGTQMQSGSRHTIYYRVVAHVRNGRKIVIADSLDGSRLADFVEAKIQAALWPDEMEQLLDQ